MANSYLRVNGAWVNVGAFGQVIPDPGDPPTGGPVPKPSQATVGPRTTVTGSTLSGSQAKAAAAANGNVLEGRRIANLTLSSPTDWQYQWLDCEITGAFFAVDAWFGQGVAPSNPGNRALFDHCLIHEASADGMSGVNFTARFCEFAENGDDSKPGSNTEIYASLLHHLRASTPDAHGDNVQCFGGNDILIHWNTVIGRNSPTSPYLPNGVASSALQMSNGGPATNIRWLDNWVSGGAYTLRGADTWGGLRADLIFRRNKHGRDYLYGPITGMGSFNGGLAVSDYDTSNVWEDTGLPVLSG